MLMLARYPILNCVVAGLRAGGRGREWGLHLLLEEQDLHLPEQGQLEKYRQLLQHLDTLGFRKELGVRVILKVGPFPKMSLATW